MADISSSPPADDRQLMREIWLMLAELCPAVDQLQAKLGDLEAEFGPLARKYSKLTGVAAALPGVGMGRGGRNGRAIISPGDLGAGRRSLRP